MWAFNAKAKKIRIPYFKDANNAQTFLVKPLKKECFKSKDEKKSVPSLFF